MSEPMTMPLLSLARWLLIFSVIVFSASLMQTRCKMCSIPEGEPYQDLASAPIVTAQNILLMTYSTRRGSTGDGRRDGRTCV